MRQGRDYLPVPPLPALREVEMIDTLDTFRLCPVGGCLWQVQSPEPVRCFDHGGPRLPQFAEAEDGDILDCRFMPCPTEDDE